MLATRYPNGSTSTNASTLVGLINDPNCLEVRLFASPSSKTSEYKPSDGSETNFPLVVALAKYAIPGVDDIYVIFDGLFLTAARRPRYLEVKDLLDVAEKSTKVTFSSTAVPFTSALDPSTAVTKLLMYQSVVILSPTTRAQYFSLICNIPEAQYP